MRWSRLAGRLLAAFAVPAIVLAAPAHPAIAAADWQVTSWSSDITIEPNSTVRVVEDIRVDFGSVASHGIWRTIPTRYRFDATHNRLLDLRIDSVTDGSTSVEYQPTATAGGEQLKIGDPTVTVTGPQRYVITYSVTGAMDAYSDRDELRWNVDSAESPVVKQHVSATVHVPAGSLQRVSCYQGVVSSTSQCKATPGADAATFSSNGPISGNEIMTVVVVLNTGAVRVAPPHLELLPASQPPKPWFDLNPIAVGVSLLILLLGIPLAAFNWWRTGRDRGYVSRTGVTGDGRQRAEPLFHHDVIAVEFGPPDHLRPAELALIVKESNEKTAIAATIIDLAVRGYLTITERKKNDYVFTWRGAADMNRLLPYELAILEGIFQGLQQRQLSDLRGKFKPALDRAADLLMKDATSRKLFTANPKQARDGWVMGGLALSVFSATLAVLFGALMGFGLPFAAVALVGLVFSAFGWFMPQRSAAGHELLLRTLGFRLYMRTAERYRQQFAERARIFTQLLPYAIAFGCVDEWAAAFAGIDTSSADGWFLGPATLDALVLASSLESFTFAASSDLSASASGSGGSGFGDFAGGGFGGGGFGKW